MADANPRRGDAGRIAGVLLVCLAAGCLWHGDAGDPLRELEPGPVLALVGRAEAKRIRFNWDLIPGPGAEGRAGDYLIENAYVRFVVGAVDHLDP